MSMIMGELIGVSIILLIALYVAVTILIEEIKEDIADYKRRNHWRNRYK